MVAILQLLALVGTISLASAAPTTTSTATNTCTSVTSTVNFNDLPTGKVSPTLNYHGLNYHGWEVVAAKDTVFKPQNKSANFLRLIGHTGLIKTANPKLFYDDLGGPSDPSFYFGCQNQTHSDACGFAKRYNVPGDTKSQNEQYNTYQGFFNAADYPHNLEPAGNPQPISVHTINWSVFNSTGFGAPKSADLHLYIAEYIYAIGNCENSVRV